MDAFTRVRVCAWMTGIAALSVMGCAAKKTDGPVIHVLAVLPIERAVAVDAATVAAEHEPLPEDAGTAVTGQIYAALAHESVFRFVPDLTASDAVRRPSVRDASDLSARAQAFGKEVGADGVIFGRVSRFRERVGTEYGASSPAAVSLDLSLLRVADGSVLWQDSFDETQESLSANLLDFWMFWEGGPRWFTVRELTGLGVEKMLKQMRKTVR